MMIYDGDCRWWFVRRPLEEQSSLLIGLKVERAYLTTECTRAHVTVHFRALCEGVDRNSLSSTLCGRLIPFGTKHQVENAVDTLPHSSAGRAAVSFVALLARAAAQCRARRGVPAPGIDDGRHLADRVERVWVLVPQRCAAAVDHLLQQWLASVEPAAVAVEAREHERAVQRVGVCLAQSLAAASPRLPHPRLGMGQPPAAVHAVCQLHHARQR
eukprot:359828-Chlamydomonas_euryale.AAC.3